MLQLRVALPVLTKRSLRPVSTSVSAFGTAKDEKPHLKDDTYELLPPGASMKEPSYDFGPKEKLYGYKKPEAAAKPKMKNVLPSNLEAAKKELKSKQKKDDEDAYVYLPPGSSMREPGDSMSDPAYEGAAPKVYYRYPNKGFQPK